MKFLKIALVMLLALAMAFVLFGCPAPDDGGTTTTTPPAGGPSTPSDPSSPSNPSNPSNPGSGNPSTPVAFDTEKDGVKYALLNSETSAIVGYTDEIPASLTIPSVMKVKGLDTAVVQISAGAFANCDKLTELVIPETMLSIECGAFAGCDKLATIKTAYIGGSATANNFLGYIFGARSFTENAAYVPESLKTVILTDACKNIASFAFDGCKNITDIQLSDLTETIGAYAFSGCSGLTAVKIPAGVTAVGAGVFANCDGILTLEAPFIGADATGTKDAHIGYLFGTSSYVNNAEFVSPVLKNVTIYAGCTTLGDGAFYGCATLAEPNLPSSVVNIGTDAFAGTKFYENKPDGLVYIGEENAAVLYTYKGELASTDITIKPGTVAIAAGAFKNLPITSVSIPDSVAIIGIGAFEGTSLAEISLPFLGEKADSQNAFIGYIFGAATVDAQVETATHRVLPETLKTVTLNSNCTKIGTKAFYGCKTLTTVHIGASVTDIAKDAFFACDSLATISVDSASASYKNDSGLVYNLAGNELFAVPMAISGSVTLLDIEEIGDGQFQNCKNLTEVALPATLLSIGKEAFAGAEKLASLGTVPADIEMIGYKALEGTKWYDNCADGMIRLGKTIYRVKGAMETVEVPDGILYITEGAFEETGAKKATLPNTIKGMGVAIFKNCSEMTEATVPFLGCSADDTAYGFVGSFFGSPTTLLASQYVPASFEKLVIHDTCTQIPAEAFKGCAALADITFPNSIVSVASDALDETPYFANSAAGVLYIGRVAYRFIAPADASSVDADFFDIVLRDDTVAVADEAFRNAAIRTLRIPDTTVYIGQNAFRNCKSLESMRMSPNLETLGNTAFADCSALKAAYVPGSVKVIGGGAFNNCSKLQAIYLEEGIEEIRDNAFNRCNAVLNIFFKGPGRGTAWNALLASDGFSETGNGILTSGVRMTFDSADGTRPAFNWDPFNAD